MTDIRQDIGYLVGSLSMRPRLGLEGAALFRANRYVSSAVVWKERRNSALLRERVAIRELFKGWRRLSLVKIRQFSTREIRAKDHTDCTRLSGTRLPSSWNLNQGDLCPLTIKEKSCQRPQNVMSLTEGREL